VVVNILHDGNARWDRTGGVHIVVKVKNSKEDLGIRLLKILLLRLYELYSDIPLKWYEQLIAVIVGALCGLGIGMIIGHYLKSVVG